MSRHTNLSGWEVQIRERNVPVMKPGGEQMQKLTDLVFVERKPPTGDTITFTMDRQGKDAIVKALTHGIVLASGQLPTL